MEKEADHFVHIPMYGFTESFNISVSAALCMYELSRRIREEVKDCLLSENEKEGLYLQWLCTTVQHSETLIERFLSGKE